MRTIAIIGAGASGLAAAVEAAHEAERSGCEARIELYEAADRVGKSILATGNGRCNLSNASVDASLYRNAGFVAEALSALPESEVLSLFGQLGLIVREESDGRLYPATNKASSVLDILRFAVRERGVQVSCGAEVGAVEQAGTRFRIGLSGGSDTIADAVVIACGGRSIQSLAPTAHRIVHAEPVLGPIATETATIKGLNNIRVRCAVSLFDGIGKNLKAKEEGEVLFRDYGVSGIAVFNLSRFSQKGDVLSLDLVPGITEAALAADLESRTKRMPDRTATEVLAGVVVGPVARAVLGAAGLNADEALRTDACWRLARSLKSFELAVQGPGDVRQCQVTRGGLDVAQFRGDTMESLLHQGLYAAGEALDVDGPCGGFNLHWAWASGMLSGRSAVRTCCR